MFSAIYNYLHCVFFPKAVIGRKRRVKDNSEFPPKKLIRMDTKNFFGKGDSFLENKSEIVAEEDSQYDEDNECYIVAEIANKNFKTLPPRARKSIRKNQKESVNQTPCVKIAEVDTARSADADSSFTSTEKSIEIIKYVTSNNLKKSIPDEKNEAVSKNVFGCFRKTAEESNKLRDVFHGKVRERINFLRESYRLAEKYQYGQLLQSLTCNPGSFLSSTSQKTGCGKIEKAPIPLIDLTKEKCSVTINRSREDIPWTLSCNKKDDDSIEHISICDKGQISKVNSFEDYIKTNPATQEDVVEQILSRHTKVSEEIKKQAELETAKLQVLGDSNRKAYGYALEERLKRYMRITTPAVAEAELEIDEKYILPKLSAEQEERITQALVPSPPGQTLVEKFGLQIKRRDMQTLKGLNWLNDEVINFYMNLIMERGNESKHLHVYAFNTFFYPKLMSSGQASLKRWTKKIDIFSFDMVLVPVHLGMHWCMSVIDFRTKEVRYYDSMGSTNNACLQALLTYLEDESLDKKKVPYSTADWKKKNVDDIPQQMNGSDCGVFSCMFAEHLSRGVPILFSQDNMPYFRRKMVLEILSGKLLT